MIDEPRIRGLLVDFLARWYDVSQKEIAVRTGLSGSGVSLYLGQRGIHRPAVLEKLLGAIPHRPAAVPLVAGCLEGLGTLGRNTDLTEDELLRIEEEAQRLTRLVREALTEAVRRSRSGPAGEIKELCVLLCEESARAASRDLKAAAVLARLARETADRLAGPEGMRLQGYSMAHEANVTRVPGELEAADAAFEEAKRQWSAGTDRDSVLDPGRILELEASLRRDQRRFDEALRLLDEAEKVGRSPERVLIKKGFTLEVMGEYERAVQALQKAAPFVQRRSDPRLENILHYNLSVNYAHLGLYKEAADLVNQARILATQTQDHIALVRMTWMDGRIAAGLGQAMEARKLLEQARREFAAHGMSYDVALAFLEEAVLLLNEGRTSEVKGLAGELIVVFESKGVHREALAALRLFQEAAERETATADFARSVLSYLFRARHDQGLQFTPL
jgi:tetratricopeptide (TPR) repeat protein